MIMNHPSDAALRTHQHPVFAKTHGPDHVGMRRRALNGRLLILVSLCGATLTLSELVQAQPAPEPERATLQAHLGCARATVGGLREEDAAQRAARTDLRSQELREDVRIAAARLNQ